MIKKILNTIDSCRTIDHYYSASSWIQYCILTRLEISMEERIAIVSKLDLKFKQLVEEAWQASSEKHLIGG